MAAIVPLSFTPPESPFITTLHVFESNAADGVFTEIASAPAGTYPDYITRYVITNAISSVDWFAIQWEDSSGARSDLSAPIQGGTNTLVGELVDRALLRNSDLNKLIVTQEAEAIVQFVYGVDPFLVDPNTVNDLYLTELTNLVLVAAQYVTVSVRIATSQGYSAGMVSEQSGASAGDPASILNMLDRVEKRALKRLGLGGSIIAAIDDTLDDVLLSLTGQRTVYDSSRILSTREVITENVLMQDVPTGTIISDR